MCLSLKDPDARGQRRLRVRATSAGTVRKMIRVPQSGMVFGKFVVRFPVFFLFVPNSDWEGGNGRGGARQRFGGSHKK